MQLSLATPAVQMSSTAAVQFNSSMSPSAVNFASTPVNVPTIQHHSVGQGGQLQQRATGATFNSVQHNTDQSCLYPNPYQTPYTSSDVINSRVQPHHYNQLQLQPQLRMIPQQYQLQQHQQHYRDLAGPSAGSSTMNWSLAFNQ